MAEDYPIDDDADGGDETLLRSVPPEHAGKRIDQVAALLFDDYSRSRLRQWLVDGSLTVDGASPPPRTPAREGQRLALTPPIEAEISWTPEPIAFDVVHEDDDIIVVDKPADLVVHPGAGQPAGTLVNGLLHRYPRLKRLPRGGIVHRLDKDTTGLMVVARSERAHFALVAGLKARSVHRVYEAVVNGLPTGGGTVDAPIGRHRQHRTKMAVDPMGRDAVTHYEILERFHGHTRLRVILETGRTHQIRVHMAHVNMPLLGDRAYGRNRVPAGLPPAVLEHVRGFPRQALHAARLEFEHPGSGEPLSFRATTPADMRELLERLRERS